MENDYQRQREMLEDFVAGLFEEDVSANIRSLFADGIVQFYEEHGEVFMALTKFGALVRQELVKMSHQ